MEGYRLSNVFNRNYIGVYIKSVFAVLLVNHHTSMTSATVHNPPFFNVAENKPITLVPEDAVCGSGGSEETYCRSMADQTSTNVCLRETCFNSCPHTSQTSLILFDIMERYTTDAMFGSCVVKENITSPEVVGNNTVAMHFRAEPLDSTCALNLSFIPQISVLFPNEWNITYQFYIKHTLATAEKGVIIDHADGMNWSMMEIYLSGNQLEVLSGNTILRETSWVVPYDTWTHVIISVYEEFVSNANPRPFRSISVYINGQLASPTNYGNPSTGALLEPRQNVRQNVMGRAASGSGVFKGRLSGFKILMRAISNREAMQIYSGELPSIQIQSECLCPAGYPNIADTNAAYCSHNDGAPRDSQQYRIHLQSYPIGFAVDGQIDSHWISDLSRDEVSIIIDLEQVYEVHHVTIRFYSPFPQRVRIERQNDVLTSWQDWHFSALDCLTQTGYQPERDPTSADDVICKHIVPPNTALVYSGGVVTFDLLLNRDNWIRSDGQLTNELRGFLRASKLRLTLGGHPYVSDPRHKYYGLYEINVNGTCDCNGNADSCDFNQEPYQCRCAASSNAAGRLCDTCTAETYQLVDEATAFPSQCTACNCDTRGTISEDTACNQTTGQCPCKSRVQGLQCDTCQSGYYGLLTGNPDGCTQCDCEPAGVVNPDMPCDQLTGVCQCKQHVTGTRCDRCQPEYYNLRASNTDGCTACACDVAGTQNSIRTCDVTTGQCDCKTFVTGRQCDVCQAGYYFLSNSNPDGCRTCDCDFPEAQNTSCDLSTGACYCKPNVGGATCNECMPGYYALSDDDLSANGCLYDCNCSANGTVAGNTCNARDGQCMCLANTEGRTCDQCKPLTYGFGQSEELGCRACACDADGVVAGDLDCDVITGQCNCKTLVEGRQCSRCAFGYFGLSSFSADGCDACDCYALGTMANQTCDDVTGQCPCVPDAGDPDLSDRRCSAYISDVIPTFGPQAGGTTVSVVGGYLGDVDATRIEILTNTTDVFDCPIDANSSSPRSIVCLTDPLPASRTDLIDVELEIRVTLPDGSVFSPDYFTYMNDPIIEDINPLRTIVGGGIQLTVTGQFMTSVAFPYLQVTMVYMPQGRDSENRLFETPCSVQNGGQMTCPTPEIELPEGFDIQEQNRRKRDVSDDVNNHVTSSAHARRKRQAETDDSDLILNSDTLQFYLGFRLDGVTRYRNMSEESSSLGILSVYVNPEMETLDDDVTVYRPYWPFDDDNLEIKGKQLDYGADENDYKVRIGDEECDDMKLYTNKIICIPPDSQPSKGEGGSKDGAPAMTVQVGNIMFIAGYVDYEMTMWENESIRAGIIGGIVGFVVLLFLIILLCICIRKRRQARRNDDTKLAKLDHFDAFDNFVDLYDDDAKRRRSVINGYDPDAHAHFPTMSHEKKPEVAPRPVQTLPPPSSRHAKHNTGSGFSGYLNPTLQPAVMDVLTPDLRHRVERHLLQDERLVFGKLVLEGKTGNIYLGQLTDRYNMDKTTVLVKQMAESKMAPREINRFLEDTCVLRDTKNVNINSLIGIMVEDRSVVSIWPHAENFSLKAFITNDENMLTVGELIEFGVQVARGMSALVDNGVVHKDLAARNCVVTKDLVVKITDCALSRDRYPEDYWRASGMQRPLPVRWMALESLEIDVFTFKSDVWSYGIVLWELLTRGCLPYPDVKSSSIKSSLMCGNRMDRPDFCPEELYTLMLECWDELPRERPSFTSAVKRITSFLERQNTRTNLRKQMPSSRRRGHTNYAMLYQ